MQLISSIALGVNELVLVPVNSVLLYMNCYKKLWQYHPLAFGHDFGQLVSMLSVGSCSFLTFAYFLMTNFTDGDGLIAILFPAKMALVAHVGQILDRPP